MLNSTKVVRKLYVLLGCRKLYFETLGLIKNKNLLVQITLYCLTSKGEFNCNFNIRYLGYLILRYLRYFLYS